MAEYMNPWNPSESTTFKRVVDKSVKYSDKQKDAFKRMIKSRNKKFIEKTDGEGNVIKIRVKD